jgi:phytanoyl-CoA hydroxylase
MKEFFRKFKFTYQVYNFFNKSKLDHNTAIYKKLGLHKKYHSPVSSKDFKSLQMEKVVSPEEKVMQLNTNNFFKQLSLSNQKALIDFDKNGYAVIENFLSNEQVDKVNEEIDYLIKSGKKKFRYGNKIMFAVHLSEYIRNIGKDKKLIEILSILLGRKAVLFQSINFLTGSQQATHSDSIHMTTYPLGGLIAIWIALEDVGPDQGPLHYYPQSHTLPYYMNSDYDNEGNTFFIGDKDYSEYEKMIQEKIAAAKIEKKVFLPKKGDMFIWHANLFHGGEKHLDKNKTRKSMVLHYFAEGVVCFHEITQRPALMPREMFN